MKLRVLGFQCFKLSGVIYKNRGLQLLDEKIFQFQIQIHVIVVFSEDGDLVFVVLAVTWPLALLVVHVIMWGFASNAISSIGLRKSSTNSVQDCSQCSDDELCSNTSQEQGLDCPICWESFNIVENVPYVLWCGHTLCQNCVMGLQCAILKLPNYQIKIPFFIACPWCHLLSFRMVYQGILKFPRKNFFLLWMVESLNGEREKFGPALSGDCQPFWSPRCSSVLGTQASNRGIRRTTHSYHHGQLSSHGDVHRSTTFRHQFSLHKSLDFFLNLTSKFPLVTILLLLVFFAIPGSVVILLIYLLLTVIFAVPSVLVLYFAYPALDRLVREILS